MSKEKLHQLQERLSMLVLTTDPGDDIVISHSMAVTMLSSLPKAGPKLWTPETKSTAILRMLDGVPINELAREISEKTGQPELSARRRLRSLKNSRQFKEWQRV
jgi:hypothetical protein